MNRPVEQNLAQVAIVRDANAVPTVGGAAGRLHDGVTMIRPFQSIASDRGGRHCIDVAHAAQMCSPRTAQGPRRGRCDRWLAPRRNAMRQTHRCRRMLRENSAKSRWRMAWPIPAWSGRNLHPARRAPGRSSRPSPNGVSCLVGSGQSWQTGSRATTRSRLSFAPITPRPRPSCRARPAPRQAARSARGTASTTRSRARSRGRTRPTPDRRRARRRCRP